IQDINRHGLAKIDRQHNTLLVHRLVQAVVRHGMDPQQQFHLRHGTHELLANLDPGEPSRPDRWPLYEKVLPHSHPARIVECADPKVRALVTNLAQVLYYRGDHHQAVDLLTEAHETWSEQIGDSNPDSLRAAGFLGLALRTVG